MKKLLAMILALMLALACVSAFADTVYTKVTIDREVAAQLLPGFGVPEEQTGMIDTVLAVVNALGVNVTTVKGGGQVDLDLNGTPALSLGWAADDAGLGLVSTLFPNYYVTISSETIGTMMEQFMANMPGAGSCEGAGGMDMAAFGEVFGGYFARYIEAVSAAATPGEPEKVEFETDGYTFDTLVPITIDIPAIIEATDALVDEMLADEAVIASIQGSMASSGQTFNPDDFKASYEEWKTHMPETAIASFYAISDNPEVFYIEGDAFLEGKDEASYHYNMMNKGEGAGYMGYWDYETGMIIGFEYAEGAVRADFTMQEMYFGFDFITENGQTTCKLFFMDSDAPILTVEVATAEGGERTLAVDAEGKTTLAVEDAMNDQTGEAAQGLIADIQANGLGALMGAAMQAVPELGSLMGMAG